jgi:hypothetical protein
MLRITISLTEDSILIPKSVKEKNIKRKSTVSSNIMMSQMLKCITAANYICTYIHHFFSNPTRVKWGKFRPFRNTATSDSMEISVGVSCDLHSEITFDCLFSRFEFLRNI